MMEKVFRNNNFHLSFVQNVHELWRNGKLCDASIEVGSRVFKFHKIVLAIASSAFINMGENIASDNRLVIQLPVETDIQALEAVLQYIYGGELTLTQRTVETVMKLADMFKMDKIQEFCQTFHSEEGDKTENANKDIVKSKKQIIEVDVKGLKKTGGLRAGLRPSRGRSRDRKMVNKEILPEAKTSQERTQILSSKDYGVSLSSECQGGTLLTEGQGGLLRPKRQVRGRGQGKGGKSPFISLIRACSLKTELKCESVQKEENILNFTSLNNSSKESPRKRKAKSRSELLISAVIADTEQTTKSDELNVLDSVKKESNSIQDKKPGTCKRGRKPGRQTSLTRAEIQRAYRERKFSTMSPEELEAFREKERQRVRSRVSNTQTTPTSVGRGRGRGRKLNVKQGRKLNVTQGRKSNVSQRGGDIQGASGFHIDTETEKSEAGDYKVEVKGKILKKKNTERQKRYRDRKKHDPEWMKKEAERVRRRYVPVSQLSKKEHEIRRQKETERTRIWRWKKKLQSSKLPIEMVKDGEGMDDFSGKIFISRNTDESFGGDSGQDIEGSSEIVHPDHEDVSMVNSIMNTLSDQYHSMLAGESGEVFDFVKQEVIDPEYEIEETEGVCVNESQTNFNMAESGLDETVNNTETEMCNNELIDTGLADDSESDRIQNDIHESTEAEGTTTNQDVNAAVCETEEANLETDVVDDDFPMVSRTFVTRIQSLDNSGTS